MIYCIGIFWFLKSASVCDNEFPCVLEPFSRSSEILMCVDERGRERD